MKRSRLLVISDIHGMYDVLRRLLVSVWYRPEIDRLVVLGDLIDRGPQSREVLDFFMDLKKRAGDHLTILRGNHEDMCIDTIRCNKASRKQAVSLWFNNGGDATIASIVDANLLNYIKFMEQLPLYKETDEFIFVHGGVDPELPLADTSPETMLWTRDAWPHVSGKTVIVGHSIHDEVTFYPEAKTLYIDTGACKEVFGRQGRLSLVDLTNQKIHWLKTGSLTSAKTVTEDLVMWNELKLAV